MRLEIGLLSVLLCAASHCFSGEPGTVESGNKERTVASATNAIAVPDELLRFKARYEEAMAKKDLDAVGKLFLPDFLHNGKNREMSINYFSMFTPVVSRWEMSIRSVERIDGMLLVDYRILTNTGDSDQLVWFKMKDGELYFYGNQRAFKEDGRLTDSPLRK
jgi:hypothetical protein